MTTINVVLGTPHIEVDPVTSQVSIVLAGPQGPQGEPGTSGPGGDAEWGEITGTLADQTDLQDALDDKQDAGAAAGGVLSGTYPNPGFAADMATQAELNAVAAAAVNDGDTAGGVLSGTYPNPGFAADMATQAELDAVSTVANAAIAPGDAAGGDLTGTYPNPTFAVNMATQAELDAGLTLKAPLASPTFTGDVVVPDANAATEAMNRQTSDARYIRLAGDAVHLWLGTETEYAAIGAPDANTVYVVTPDP